MRTLGLVLGLSFAVMVLGCGDNSDDHNGHDAGQDAYVPACGNAIVDPGEGCDDGNTVDGDGCEADCMVAGCGNGVLDPGEQCDDHNTISGDGCDNNCKPTGCGNGVTTSGETCDDGNAVDGDGCDHNCKTTGCGNGVMTGTEACDDGNLVDGDGCDHDCSVTMCGNGIMTGTEACDDGNAVDGDGCDHNCTVTACGNGVMTGTEVCDDGNAVDGDGCDHNCTVTACGNGVMTAGEVCDDGNTVNGDGCDNNCTISGCGNGVVGGGEACDDGNTVNGDGCDNNCTATACGNAILTAGEACDDGNTVAGDGCSPTCQIECGNGVVDGTEQCDDGNAINGDGCDSNCTLTACGNGIQTGSEQCDDGNGVNGDGCTPGCRLEPGEIEPNEDGTPQIGGSGTAGNDVNATAIANATANGAFDAANGEVHIRALLSPAGDEDVFEITNSTAFTQDVRFDTWNLATSYGFGVACATSIDTVLRIYDATPTSLAFNDDRNGSADRCAGMNFALAAGGAIYVHVMAYGDNTLVGAPGYALQVRFTAVICGDGAVGAGEQCDDANTVNGDGCDNNCKTTACGNGIITGTETCDDGNAINGDGCDNNCTPTGCGNGVVSAGEVCDDGNTTSGDGCSATCQSEILVTEVEPNDTTAQADASTVQITGDAAVSGSLPAVTDVDTFRITVATGTVVRIDTLTALSPPDCVGGTTDVKLLDAGGATIISDTGAASSAMGYGGIGACGGLALYLAPGTYYAQVSNTAITASYFLVVDFLDDKGSESEPVATTGVNDTLATASSNLTTSGTAFVFGDHVLNADGDYYAISVPNGAKIRAEIIEGDRATETCESLGIDSRLTLYDQAGVQLVDDDDDGRGYCSLIDGLGTVPHDTAAKNASGAAQIYYVLVRASSFAQGATDVAGEFVYRLSVTIQ